MDLFPAPVFELCSLNGPRNRRTHPRKMSRTVTKRSGRLVGKSSKVIRSGVDDFSSRAFRTVSGYYGNEKDRYFSSKPRQPSSFGHHTRYACRFDLALEIRTLLRSPLIAQNSLQRDLWTTSFSKAIHARSFWVCTHTQGYRTSRRIQLFLVRA